MIEKNSHKSSIGINEGNTTDFYAGMSMLKKYSIEYGFRLFEVEELRKLLSRVSDQYRLEMLTKQVARLGDAIAEYLPREVGDEGACDVAIRIIKSYHNLRNEGGESL